MKILVPRDFPFIKGCDPFDCGVYSCESLSIGKKKLSRVKKRQQVFPGCGRYWCGQVTISEKET